MNKRIIPLLVITSALLLTGCGKKNADGGSGQAGDTSTSQTDGYKTVEITGSTMGGKMNNPGAYSKEIDGLKISVSNGLIDENYNTKNVEIRIYKDATLTLEATEVTKAIFTCTANGTDKQGPGNFTADVGNYTYEESGPKGTWEGSAAKIVFTAATNQVRCLTISVTYK